MSELDKIYRQGSFVTLLGLCWEMFYNLFLIYDFYFLVVDMHSNLSYFEIMCVTFIYFI